MKTGKTLVELAKELERIENAKRDFIVDTREMFLEDDMKLSIGKLNRTEFYVSDDTTTEVKESSLDLSMPIERHAMRQVGARLEIPAKYVDRLAEKHPDMLAWNVNELFQREPERRMVRTLDGRVRAFMSDSYRIMDNYDLAQHVLPMFLQSEGEVVLKSCDITPQKMYLKAVLPKFEAEIPPPPGVVMGQGHNIFVDKVQGAICLSNSEIGMGGLMVEPGNFTARCTNLAVFSNYSYKKYHIGAKHQGDEDMWEIYSDATKSLSDQAIWSKVKDVVTATLTGKMFEKIVRKLSEARGGTQIINVARAIEVLEKKTAINEKEANGILQELVKGGDLTRYGLSNAITAHSAAVESYDRASELEQLGGEIIELNPSQWKEISLAA
jgi:hypothetical protein